MVTAEDEVGRPAAGTVAVAAKNEASRPDVVVAEDEAGRTDVVDPEDEAGQPAMVTPEDEACLAGCGRARGRGWPDGHECA